MPDGPPKPKGSLYQQYMAIAPRNRIILGVAGVGLSITGLYLTEYSQKPTRINNEFYSDGRAPVLPSVKRDRRILAPLDASRRSPYLEPCGCVRSRTPCIA